MAGAAEPVRFVVQVAGPIEAGDLDGLPNPIEQVSVSEVMLLRPHRFRSRRSLAARIDQLDPGLDFRLASRRGTPGTYDFLARGPLGRDTRKRLSELADVLHHSSRYCFTDALAMGLVLTRLLDRGADLEMASTVAPGAAGRHGSFPGHPVSEW